MICVIHDNSPQSGFLAWLSFPGNTKPENARQQFQERYGHRPQALIRKGPLLCVGPVPEEGERVENDVLLPTTHCAEIEVK